MASRTSRLHGPAERFYVAASPADRAEIERILRNLCIDPWTNDKTVFVFPVPPAILNLYRDGRFWIVFHLPTADTLAVHNIGHAPTKPTPFEP